MISALESRAWTVRLAAGAIIGILIGAIVGGLVLQTFGSDRTATSFIRLTAPADLIAVAAGAAQSTPNTQDNLDRYVTGEVAYLSRHGFAQAVATKLGRSAPAISRRSRTAAL